MIVLDTHVLIWWLTDPARLSATARRALRAAAKQPGGLVVSAISVLEIVTAVRRGRLQFSQPVDAWLDDVRQLPEIRFAPVTDQVAERAAGFDKTVHGDPVDRLIAATAVALGTSLVTADAQLQAAGVVSTVW